MGGHLRFTRSKGEKTCSSEVAPLIDGKKRRGKYQFFLTGKGGGECTFLLAGKRGGENGCHTSNQKEIAPCWTLFLKKGKEKDVKRCPIWGNGFVVCGLWGRAGKGGRGRSRRRGYQRALFL